MSFGIEADKTDRDVAYDIDEENFLADFVAFSRDNQVLNEEQAMVTLMGAATGLLDSNDYHTSVIVTGGASGGKSHMLDKVIMAAFEYAADVDEDFVYELTGGSDQAGINDPTLDDARFAYFHELQKIPDMMLEFIKTVAEDGEFRFGRSQADSDADGGFRTEHIEREPLPVLFSFADENEAEAGKDQELRSRTVEVKVDESEAKNAGVHDMKWGGEEISLPSNEHEYIRDAPDREHAIKAHIRDAPTDVDVVIPYGNGAFDGDDWRMAKVVKPMFNFARSESTRASTNLAGLVKGSAILNYHARDAVCEMCGTRYGPEDAQACGYECDDCDDAALYIVAAETDVSNLIACRPTLLATTHGLTEKKFAVLDAIRERGGRANASGTAVQATKQDIVDEIQKNDDIATMTKSEIEGILEELDEHLIINKKDNPEDRRENLYVYDGSAVFEPPNIYDDYDRFADAEDPIREQPIEQTIDMHLEELNAKMDTGSMAAAEAMHGAEGGLSDFGEGDVSPLDGCSEDAQAVAQRLHDVLDGTRIPADVVEANSLKVEHMVGDAPVDRDGDVIRPAREPRGDDRHDGFMLPEGPFEDADDFAEVEQRVNHAIEECRAEGVMEMDETEDGAVEVTVNVS